MVVNKQVVEEQAMAAYSACRTRMVSFKVPGVVKPAILFFASLTLRLEPVCDWSQKTAATDGEKVYFNPQWFLGLSEDEKFFIIAHEGYHPAMAHHARMGDRDLRRWNVACDLAINPVLVESGFRPPIGVLLPGEGDFSHLPAELSAEEYYQRLSNEEKQDDGRRSKSTPDDSGDEDDDQRDGEGVGDSSGNEGTNEGDEGADGERQPGEQEDATDGEGAGGSCGESTGCPDEGGCGGIIKPKQHQPVDSDKQESDWKVATAQAAQQAKRMGELPGSLARLVEKSLQPKQDPWQILRDFVAVHAKVEQSYQRPNRRFLQQDVIFPSVSGEKLGELVVFIDCSGSITSEDLNVFAGNIQLIAEMFQCGLTLVYHDVPVTHVQKWNTGDGPLKLNVYGGGGTSHVPVFEWLNKYLPVCEEEVPCVVAFTDLYSYFPDKAPPVPVLWAVYGAESKYYRRPIPKFGTICELSQ